MDDQAAVLCKDWAFRITRFVPVVQLTAQKIKFTSFFFFFLNGIFLSVYSEM